MRILHISDTYAQAETMEQLGRLAQRLVDYDVVACTGDCVSNNTSEVEESWNEWPQRLRLMVPGHHDTPATFVHLTNGATSVPWYRTHWEVSFIGLDNCKKVKGTFQESQLAHHVC